MDVLWFVCRYGGSCSLLSMPSILGLVVMQHNMCSGDWATVNWITSAQRSKMLPEIENMIILVYSYSRLIVLNFVQWFQFQVHWPQTVNDICLVMQSLFLFVVVGCGAVGRHQQSWSHSWTDLWRDHGYRPSHQEQAPPCSHAYTCRFSLKHSLMELFIFWRWQMKFMQPSNTVHGHVTPFSFISVFWE